MTRKKLFAAPFLLVLTPTSGGAQASGCAANDTACLAARAVVAAVSDFKDRDGVLEYAAGDLCQDDVLKAYGVQHYRDTLPQVIADAKEKFKATGVSALAAGPYLSTMETAVRVARSMEGAGIVAGLESSFRMYPASRAEYCERMKAAVRARSQ